MVAALPIVLVGVGAGGLSPLVRALPVELEGVGLLREATGTYATGIAVFSCGGVLVVAAGAAMDIRSE